MSDFTQTVPELVSWARKNDFSISLPPERLAFLMAVAVLNSERLDGEMSEGELIDAFREVCKALINPQNQYKFVLIMPLMIWSSSGFLTVLPVNW